MAVQIYYLDILQSLVVFVSFERLALDCFNQVCGLKFHTNQVC